MPKRASRPCRAPGCPNFQSEHGYCNDHQGAGWQRYQQGKTTTQRGYGHRWQKLREIVIRRDKGLCQIHLQHGKYVTGNEVDHIVEKKHGGTDELANLQLLCRACHATKTSRGRGVAA